MCLAGAPRSRQAWLMEPRPYSDFKRIGKIPSSSSRPVVRDELSELLEQLRGVGQGGDGVSTTPGSAQTLPVAERQPLRRSSTTSYQLVSAGRDWRPSRRSRVSRNASSLCHASQCSRVCQVPTIVRRPGSLTGRNNWPPIHPACPCAAPSRSYIAASHSRAADSSRSATCVITVTAIDAPYLCRDRT